MHEALRSGLELPALTPGAGRHGRAGENLVAAVRRVVAEAASAGFGTVWFADAPAAHGDGEVWGDPCVLAAACAATASPMYVGVVAGDGSGRHPAAVAREVTALDHVSAGRAAVRLDYAGRAVDAARVCRSLFTESVSTVHGPAFHIEGAANLPPPVQAGGPPLVAGVEPGEVDGDLAATVDAVCVDGDADEVAHARAAAAGGSAVLWAGTLPTDSDEAARQVVRLRVAGADGFVCRAGDVMSLTAETIVAWAAAANGAAP